MALVNLFYKDNNSTTSPNYVILKNIINVAGVITIETYYCIAYTAISHADNLSRKELR
jgi:hypothetical protein